MAEALRATNIVTAVGRLPKDYLQYLVLSTAELTSLEDVRKVVVAFREQTPVYVGDVAEVREGVIDRTTLISGSGQPAAVVSVARQIRGNILAVVDGAKAALNEYRSSLPPSVRLTVVYDLAEFVRNAVASVRDAIAIGGLLAVLVLIFFLRDWRVTAIAAISLPLTIVGTFFILHLVGGTINLMSLGGLAIAIGLVIDDAIVIVENIHRHRAAGETVTVAAGEGHAGAAGRGRRLDADDRRRLRAARAAAGRRRPVLRRAVDDARRGRAAVAGLRAAVHPGRGGPVPARARPAARAKLGWLSRRYRSLLTWSAEAAGARHRASRWRSPRSAALLFTRLETGFLPEMDEGGYIVDYWTPEGTSLPETDRMLKRVEDVLKNTPEVASFARRTGAELGMFATRPEHRRHRRPAEAAVRADADRRGGHRGAARDLREGDARHDDRVRHAAAGHARRPRRATPSRSR